MRRQDWKPRTEIGKMVERGDITSIDQIFENGWKIREPEVVDALIPNVRSEIILFGGSPGKGGGIKRTSTRRTVRMHRSGRRFRISALVAVGAPGYLGLGKSTANEHAVAINKATEQAKLNLIPILRGCGSWECVCGEAHSLPIKTTGKAGSVTAQLLPAPKGLGLAIGGEGKKLLVLSGVKDIWCKILGQTTTRYNYVWAIFGAFKALNRMRGELPEPKLSEEEIKQAEAATAAAAAAEAPAETPAPPEAAEAPKTEEKEAPAVEKKETPVVEKKEAE